MNTDNMILIDGLWWPSDCGNRYKTSLRRTKSMMVAVEICRNKDRLGLVLQAGGSMGVWPIELSKHFDFIYTFEPEPMSFACLVHNTKCLENISAFPWALGSERKRVGIKRKSLTSHHIVDEGGHPVAMVPLDCMDIDNVDAILLDVEGMELDVLAGAQNILKKYLPLVLVEEKKNSEIVSGYLKQFGYRQTKRVKQDGIYEAD